MWGAIFSAVLGGIASYSSARRADKTSAADREHSREMVGLEGDEQRKTLEYSGLLADHYRRKERDDKHKGLANLTQFAPKTYELANPYEYAPDDPPSYELFSANKKKPNGN